jgi:hypothetical protein
VDNFRGRKRGTETHITDLRREFGNIALHSMDFGFSSSSEIKREEREEQKNR